MVRYRVAFDTLPQFSILSVIVLLSQMYGVIVWLVPFYGCNLQHLRIEYPRNMDARNCAQSAAGICQAWTQKMNADGIITDPAGRTGV